jgi:hypothetical protein
LFTQPIPTPLKFPHFCLNFPFKGWGHWLNGQTFELKRQKGRKTKTTQEKCQKTGKKRAWKHGEKGRTAE